jgi:hypothetical protein
MSYANVTRGDILDIFVRQDRVKKIIEKKEKEWLQEEKDKKNGVGGPIKFGSDKEEKEKEEFLDWMLEMMEEDSDEEDSDEEDSDEEDSDEKNEENNDKSEKEEEKLPSFEGSFVPKKLTVEEIVKQRIDAYSSTLYHMEEMPFVRLCIKEGVLDEDQVFF